MVLVLFVFCGTLWLLVAFLFVISPVYCLIVVSWVLSGITSKRKRKLLVLFFTGL